MKAYLHLMLSTILLMAANPVLAETLPTNPDPSEERARFLRVIQDPEIRARLISHGVDAREVEARVAALTDEEAALLASRFDELPAGGQGDAIVLIVAIAAVIYIIKYVLPFILIGGGFLLLVKAAKSHTAEQGS